MGPRSAERGSIVTHGISFAVRSLQWGHVRLNVEVSVHEGWGREKSDASMGPRSAERGSVVYGAAAVGVVFASMGPRSAERGSQSLLLRLTGPPGRASMGPRSAERGSRCSQSAGVRESSMLQWGHVRLNVEVAA